MSPPQDPEETPTSPLILDPSGGANQVRVRAHNERLVLSLVRRHGALSKADIARRSGLSAQTVSVIMRALEKDGLLSRGEPVRGRVGQPSIPMRLNPDAVLSFGVKIGRRSADLVLMDFVGQIRMQLHQIYPYPLPQDILSFVTSGIQELESRLNTEERGRLAGLGIAAPFELWNWAEEVGAPDGAMEVWRGVDLQAEIAARVPYPVYLQNDATSACGAELVFGVGPHYPDFVYFFIGSFLGGGIVLNSSIFVGRTGTAGALGPLPVRGRNGETLQLLEIASIFVLENLLRDHGFDPQPLWYSADNWIDFGEPLEIWIQETAKALAQAIVAAASVIDFSAAVIDGGFPNWVRERVVRATIKEAAELDLQGVVMPEIIEGMVGPQARAIGGASLPIFARYLIDQNILFKEIEHAEGH
ncbi:ROK family transcriptional regulator [Agrobacterium sp. SHOUNA12C]|uniref:Sugar transcriptional regulator protein n=2 Tax=Rhizobium rhizogenes TaxID=359 RepID=B9J8H0_RHIR8|nr:MULTISPECIES: ROK family transcriptional regulator [Rhizobium]ACM25357.1 sugar transcriptional regulator protein [Rhizobium rhizogenes K84]KAA6486907.1 ROK family transcriptional regulator [Agrobacterium sp. ICMP 7243]MCJ9723656.1 ROK family transcriptional regulator [Agrobacterium sp. BETTINA12B]MCJ9759131.1 ROK family transcriptional regulator [Agrobacterium sp. SHOUNA12C]OCI97980.1 sugar kinase [Agrobacterium sp. 13-626]OCJ21705.1 sugar kinase [Agrobacterium sp. B131/95]OCJ27142.1 suga